jgi:hypothetical protein
MMESYSNIINVLVSVMFLGAAESLLISVFIWSSGMKVKLMKINIEPFNSTLKHNEIERYSIPKESV